MNVHSHCQSDFDNTCICCDSADVQHSGHEPGAVCGQRAPTPAVDCVYVCVCRHTLVCVYICADAPRAAVRAVDFHLKRRLETLKSVATQVCAYLCVRALVCLVYVFVVCVCAEAH
jgi:hypothetical protein